MFISENRVIRIVCLVNEPVFCFRIHNIGVGLSGYKWLIHHLLDVWCWESHLTSLYHHLPKLYCDHTISINKWNNAWAVPDEWWTLFLFIMSKYSVFPPPPPCGRQVCWLPWTASYSLSLVLIALVHCAFMLVSSGPDIHVALSLWSTPTTSVVSSWLFVYSLSITNFQCQARSVMIIFPIGD